MANSITMEDLEEVIGSTYQDGELEIHVVSNTGKNDTMDKNDKIDNNKPPWRSGKGRRTYIDNCVSQHLSGAGSSLAGSVDRDLNLQKLLILNH